MMHVNEAVSVWVTPDGRPERIEWRAQRFAVSDTPTRMGAFSENALGFVTHPPRYALGWRFQGTAESGMTHIFDIGRDSDSGRWTLLRTYD